MWLHGLSCGGKFRAPGNRPQWVLFKPNVIRTILGASKFSAHRPPLTMTISWDIADEDISIILSCHRSTATVEAARTVIDESRVIGSLARFADFADQVAAASCSIEDQLIEAGLVAGVSKRYEMPTCEG